MLTFVSALSRLARPLGAAALLAAALCGATRADANLVGNPSFESGTTGWKVYNGTSIARVAGGVDGAFALEVRGGDDLTTFGINDSPNWIAAGEPLARYRFTAHVRATGGAGHARLQIREYKDGVQLGETLKTPLVPITAAWQAITGDFVATTAGSTLDFQILDVPAAPHETFLVDQVAIVIVHPDAPPLVSVDSLVYANEGERLELIVTATDPDGDPITSLVADLAGLPPGADAGFTAYDGNASGVLHWTPTFDDAGGPFSVRFFAGNRLAGLASTEILVGNVDRPPLLEAPENVVARDSALLVVEIAASDPDGDVIEALEADLSGLPPGHDARFDVSGTRTEAVLTWRPALGASGTFQIPISAANTGVASLVMTIDVSRIEHPPVVQIAARVTTPEARRLEMSVTAFDPDGDPLTSLVADLSALPPHADAVFTPSADLRSGVLAWTPGYADAGVFPVTVTARNAEATTARVTIEVENVDRAPVVGAPAAVTAFEGQRLEIPVTAADPDGEAIADLRADLAALPSGHGASFVAAADRRTGTLAWTPRATDHGTHAVGFAAANALGGAMSTSIRVRPPNRPPVAALAVSPEVTSTPMLVTADASASVDPDDPIATYRFDFGNGVVVGPQPSPLASAMLTDAGIGDVTVIVTDPFGACDTASARVRAHLGNLCTNPGLENTAAGWATYGGATVARVAGAGRSGDFAFEATKASGANWGFNDVPDWVPVTAGPGRTYRVLAWVRSPASRGQVFLRVQEFLGTTQKGVTRTSPLVTLADRWQLLAIDYMVTAPGTRLDLKILHAGNTAPERFLVDDVQVLLLPAGDQPPVLMAPAAVTAIAGQRLAVRVRAADPDGQPIAGVGASLAALPPGHDARFVPDADLQGGVLTWTPRTADVSPEPYTVALHGSNGLAATAPLEIVVADAPVANLCANPGFESGTSGWAPYVYGAALSRVNAGRTGKFAVQLTHPSTSGCGLNDERDVVLSVPAAGRTYRFVAWVRSATSAAKVRMRVQEFLGTAQKGATVESREVALTTQWQRLAVSYTATTAGTRLDLKILNAPQGPGETFLVDDVEILAMPAGDRPPVATAPPSLVVPRQQPMTVTVSVADPEGDPIGALAADLAGLPPGHGATFTPGSANGTGILSWTPGADAARAAPYVVTFTASNTKTALATTAITVTAAAPPNLCPNPGFETSLAGWGTYGAATLARVAGGRGAGFAMRMTGSTASSFGADDRPDVVASVAAAGERYRFSAWVRSDSSASPIRLRVLESLGGVQLGAVTQSYEVPGSPSWQLVMVDHVALAAGSALSLRIVMAPNAPGQKFLVDDVCIQRLPADAALVAGERSTDLEPADDHDVRPVSADAPAFAATVAPHPLRGAGTLAFTLPRSGPVRAALFDAQGRRLRTLIDEACAAAGRHAVDVHARGVRLSPGMYFYRVEAPGTGVLSGRVVVLE